MWQEKEREREREREKKKRAIYVCNISFLNLKLIAISLNGIINVVFYFKSFSSQNYFFAAQKHDKDFYLIKFKFLWSAMTESY